MYDEENETKENERNGFIFIEDLFPEIKQLISDEVRRQSEKNPNTPRLNESVMRNMIHHVNYPKMGLYYHRYKDYLSAPVKLVLDIYLARGYIVHANLVNEGDQIIDEVYIPARPNNGYEQQYVIDKIFRPFDEDTIVFHDGYNTGSDLLGDHYLQYKTESLSRCRQLPNKRWYILGVDEDEQGNIHTGRFRIYPHPGHKRLVDLMKYAQCYKFDEEVNGWVYDENKRNHVIKFMKGALKLRVEDEVGDVSERISDYSKLIYFLLYQHKEKLSDEQVEILEQLLPTEAQLTKILKRDLLVKSIIERTLNEDIPDHYKFEL